LKNVGIRQMTYGEQKIMKDAINYLKTAYIYAQRIDWFLSGDDGEESLIKRLKDELDAVKV
jgi:hypothetical protein